MREKPTTRRAGAVDRGASAYTLHNLWLEPREIGSGYGAQLFSHAVSVARDMQWIPFYIAADPFALKFYLKVGCRQIGFEKSQVLENLYLPLLEFQSDG